jgi:hypothetical protein
VKTVWAALAGGVLIGLASSANAILIDHGDTTLDTITGYEWLDLTLNTNISYATMVEGDLNGYGPQGYRHASKQEVMAFWTHAGIPVIPSAPWGGSETDPANIAPMLALLELVGQTSPNPAIQITEGVTSTDSTDAVGNVIPRYKDTAWFDAGVGRATIGFQIEVIDNRPITGHWLIRSIPVSNTSHLFGLALVCLTMAMRTNGVRVAWHTHAARPAPNHSIVIPRIRLVPRGG